MRTATALAAPTLGAMRYRDVEWNEIGYPASGNWKSPVSLRFLPSVFYPIMAGTPLPLVFLSSPRTWITKRPVKNVMGLNKTAREMGHPILDGAEEVGHPSVVSGQSVHVIAA
jgi:hypothetical protein